jgi:hypothetical protein
MKYEQEILSPINFYKNLYLHYTDFTNLFFYNLFFLDILTILHLLDLKEDKSILILSYWLIIIIITQFAVSLIAEFINRNNKTRIDQMRLFFFI